MFVNKIISVCSGSAVVLLGALQGERSVSIMFTVFFETQRCVVFHFSKKKKKKDKKERNELNMLH